MISLPMTVSIDVRRAVDWRWLGVTQAPARQLLVSYLVHHATANRRHERAYHEVWRSSVEERMKCLIDFQSSTLCWNVADEHPNRATERFHLSATWKRDRLTRCLSEGSNGIDHRVGQTEAIRKHERVALPINAATHQRQQLLMPTSAFRNGDGPCPR